MKALFLHIVSCASLLVSGLCAGNELSGDFRLSEEIMDVSIENKGNMGLIIEGLGEGLRSARFFCENGDEVEVRQERLADPKSFQNWTRLLGASPDGRNPGSVHRIILSDIVVSEVDALRVSYLVLDIKIILIGDEGRLLPDRIVSVRLDKK